VTETDTLTMQALSQIIIEKEEKVRGLSDINRANKKVIESLRNDLREARDLAEMRQASIENFSSELRTHKRVIDINKSNYDSSFNDMRDLANTLVMCMGSVQKIIDSLEPGMTETDIIAARLEFTRLSMNTVQLCN